MIISGVEIIIFLQDVCALCISLKLLFCPNKYVKNGYKEVAEGGWKHYTSGRPVVLNNFSLHFHLMTQKPKNIRYKKMMVFRYDWKYDWIFMVI